MNRTGASVVDRGYTVEVRDDLAGPYAADRSTRTICVPAGLTLDAMHARVFRCLLYLEGGVEWAPEFAPPGTKPGRGSHLRLVADGAR